MLILFLNMTDSRFKPLTDSIFDILPLPIPHGGISPIFLIDLLDQVDLFLIYLFGMVLSFTSCCYSHESSV